MKISKLSFAVAVLVWCAGFCSAQSQDNPDQAAARKVLDQLLQEAPPPATNAPPPAVKKSKPAKVKHPKPKPAEVKPTPVVAEKTTVATQATAVSQANTEVKKPSVPAKAKPAASEPVAGASQPSTQPKSASGDFRYKPIVAPPPPVSAAKLTQLDDLLDLYKANRITSVDYQKQRAAILAEPN